MAQPVVVGEGEVGAEDGDGSQEVAHPLMLRPAVMTARHPGPPGGYSWLLQAATDGRDALGVEAEPVHPARVARGLDLDAAVHDDGEAGASGYLIAFLVDHAVLAPQGTCPDRHRIPGNRGQGSWRAEDI